MSLEQQCISWLKAVICEESVIESDYLCSGTRWTRLSRLGIMTWQGVRKNFIASGIQHGVHETIMRCIREGDENDLIIGHCCAVMAFVMTMVIMSSFSYLLIVILRNNSTKYGRFTSSVEYCVCKTVQTRSVEWRLKAVFLGVSSAKDTALSFIFSTFSVRQWDQALLAVVSIIVHVTVFIQAHHMSFIVWHHHDQCRVKTFALIGCIAHADILFWLKLVIGFLLYTVSQKTLTFLFF